MDIIKEATESRLFSTIADIDQNAREIFTLTYEDKGDKGTALTEAAMMVAEEMKAMAFEHGIVSTVIAFHDFCLNDKDAMPHTPPTIDLLLKGENAYWVKIEETLCSHGLEDQWESLLAAYNIDREDFDRWRNATISSISEFVEDLFIEEIRAYIASEGAREKGYSPSIDELARVQIWIDNTEGITLQPGEAQAIIEKRWADIIAA